MVEIAITVTDEVAARLAVLAPGCTIAEVVAVLVDHAQQGVYRPGAWEHAWVCQAFGDEWLERMEPDTRPGMLSGDGGVIFQRPKATREDGSDD